MSCFYSDDSIQCLEVIALEYAPATISWKRFRDDIFIVWSHSIEIFTDTLEFLELKLKFDKESKQISLNVFSKDNKFFHMFSLVCVFLKITLKTSLKVLLHVLKTFAILMRNSKRIVQHIQTIWLLGITGQVKRKNNFKTSKKRKGKKT